MRTRGYNGEAGTFLIKKSEHRYHRRELLNLIDENECSIIAYRNTGNKLDRLNRRGKIGRSRKQQSMAFVFKIDLCVVLKALSKKPNYRGFPNLPRSSEEKRFSERIRSP
jgi:hypothetical protein